MTTIELKTELINAVRTKLEQMITRQKHAMTEAQKEANSHKGAMVSRYDTFKEEAQTLRDGHARQLQVIAEAAALMGQLQPSHCETVGLGAVLSTSQGNYFVSTGLIDDALTVAGERYECVSISAPIIRQLRGLAKGAAIKTPGGVTTVNGIL
jgi:hypothetical protein